MGSPLSPPFPVYGLADSFTGPRWFKVWNWWRGSERGRLWHVGLGHGDPNAGHVIVHTDAKHWWQARHRGGRPRSNVTDAARAALLHMNDLAFPPDPDGRRSAGFLDEDHRAAELAYHLAPPEWTPQTIAVENQPVLFWTRTVNDAWAAVADVGPVAVGAAGSEIPLDEHGLRTVNDRLDDYRA
ncbi:hypothetical protein [Actinopolymorpha alba]|uniref:hypothetical protein n=1 Tax=Actinopolymorpha alba TaxID=533267 RepID=UPI0012F62CE0|nr:hypothetical protein [Actinopolymorpha alba]